ncbi:MAG: hypothetical protein M9920_10020 [Verrucomicrobiae bacterium]|nr:hypothetical protein [Verrucomicrobiae bacterium]
MNSINTQRVAVGAALGLLMCLAPSALQATPYACDVTNNAGIVSFRLNEAADNVKIVHGATSIDLGAGVKGLTVTDLTANFTDSGVIKVEVTRSASAGYTQSSADDYQDPSGYYVNKFYYPRSITVNKYPSSPTFGRIYVANTSPGTTTTSGVSRYTGRGIFMLNSDDSAALDTGDNPRTAGLNWDNGGAASPYRLRVNNDDNNLYIADYSDSQGGLWYTDLDVSSENPAGNVLDVIGDAGATTGGNHGSVAMMWVEGAITANNLTVWSMDEDLLPANSFWRYDIGSGPLPSTVSPVKLSQATSNNANNTGNMVRGGEHNYFYLSINRSAGTDAATLRVFDEDGTLVWDSLAASLETGASADLLRNSTSIDLSYDGKTLALLGGAAIGGVRTIQLTNGIPDFSTLATVFAVPATDSERDIAFDAAGNLYVVSNPAEFLRIFSRGGTTVATTGTDGTFDLTVPQTEINLATSSNGNEAGPVNGGFTLTRTGNTADPLTVNYTVTGTATSGTDYVALPGSVTFQAGEVSTVIPVVVTDDSEAEFTETVVLTIDGSLDYAIGNGSATVSILDDEPATISIAPVGEMRLLEGYSAQKLGFTLSRKGLISSALSINISYSGTAANGVDYNAPASVALAAEAATATFYVTPIDDDTYEGDETLNLTVGSGSYTVGTPSVANVTVIDDDYPAGTVLFADNFDTDSSALWAVNAFDAANATATFAEDYSVTGYVPPSKPGGTTKGLVFRANLGPSLNANAISASPLGLDLTGDYRLRFKAWNNYNGPIAGGGSGSTYHLTAGVGTTGDHAQFSGGNSDGIWFDMNGDGESTTAFGDTSAYADNFVLLGESGVYAAGSTEAETPRSSGNEYYSIWGGIQAPAAQIAAYPVQAGTTDVGSFGVSWHTVVIGHETNTVYWVIDGILIASVPDSSTTLGPNLFVGWADNFNNSATSYPNPAEMSFGIIDDLRVETIAAAPIEIHITGIALVGGNVEITFTAPADLSTSQLRLQGAVTVDGSYNTDNSANISQTGPGVFKATTTLSGASHFYRIMQQTVFAE